ncbi:MAG: hypothetical protein MZU95_07805 [Desulfomicrobium escambiense]|nr:hypothetical protein [Desulfomicrobium escambiense]
MKRTLDGADTGGFASLVTIAWRNIGRNGRRTALVRDRRRHRRVLQHLHAVLDRRA